MSKNYRFGDYVREMTICQKQVKYQQVINELVSNPTTPTQHQKTKLNFREKVMVLNNYLGSRFKEQLNTIAPLAIYLILFQTLILQQTILGIGPIVIGLTLALLGLVMFMEGLKVGLMPFGELIGNQLPVHSTLLVVLVVAFLLGIGVTLAEPAIGVLKTAGSNVTAEKAPYLFLLLNLYSVELVAVVGAGVGLALVLGILRFWAGWSLKRYLHVTLAVCSGLTLWIAQDTELAKILGLAWDCGAVTTGPVTVPLVLALGIGVSTSIGKNRTSLSGFGIVTLASLFPVIGVMLLGLFVKNSHSPNEILATVNHLQAQSQTVTWLQQQPYREILAGLQAILPLIGFLFFILWVVLGKSVEDPKRLGYGLTLCTLGIILFGIGLDNGLTALGNQSGGIVPAAFMRLSSVTNSPLYQYFIGLGVALCFAFFLGFGATRAEPALNALGVTVENLTSGVFQRATLVQSVSLGVAVGIMLGMTKLIFSLPIYLFLLPGYSLAWLLTFLSPEEYVNIAWDSAGVTTGPVTVPLVLSLGLGFGSAMKAIEGFGVLSLASIGPIISVLLTGLYISWRDNRRSQLT